MKKIHSDEPIPDVLYDTPNLRIHAEYEVEVYEDVFWVPVNQLGGTRYISDIIKTMVSLPPEQKQAKISTLYEAIQLYQASSFRGVPDNYDVVDHECARIWQFHKPGYHAIRTNEGCCAANSNWLAYLLYGHYEQMGFLSYTQRNSSGHIMNYIFHDGWYYFIDMMMYRVDSLPYAGIETGTESGYKDGEYIAGKLHKSRSPVSYVKYCLANHREAPVFFAISSQREVVATGADYRISKPLTMLEENDIREGDFDILYPLSSNAIVLYLDNSTQ